MIQALAFLRLDELVRVKHECAKLINYKENERRSRKAKRVEIGMDR